MRAASGGASSEDYLKFAAEASGNVSAAGNFSIQVLSRALETYGVGLAALDAPEAAPARAKPEEECGFLCNLASAEMRPLVCLLFPRVNERVACVLMFADPFARAGVLFPLDPPPLKARISPPSPVPEVVVSPPAPHLLFAKEKLRP